MRPAARAPAAGNCADCRALVALRPDRSCPNCGLVDALRPLPVPLAARLPDLKKSILYTAARVVVSVGVPVATPLLAYIIFRSYVEIPFGAYPFLVFAGAILGFALAPLVGRLIAYLPWLAVQLVNHAVLRPYRYFRLRRRTAPTFQHSIERLSQRRVELSNQLSEMFRARHEIRKILATRGPGDTSSKQRLSAAEEALDAGIQARQDAVEAIDAVQCEVDCQRLECEMTAVRLLPTDEPGAAARKLAHLGDVRRSIQGLLERAKTLTEASRRARVSGALKATKDRLRETVEHVQAVEDQGLLVRTAGLLNQVDPVADRIHHVPPAASFDTPDFGAQLLRIEDAVTECVEQKLRLRAEMAAVDDVNALCESESEAQASREKRR